MTNEKHDCYIIKQKDGILLKFCYDIKIGIYYQIFTKKNWSDKKIIYEESFEHFCALANENGGIYVFCQDICGDLILCTLERTEWRRKILLHMKYNVIMPIYIRALFCCNDIHLFYNLVDQNTYSEVLVHQIAKDGTWWLTPQVISKLDHYRRFPYCISKDCKSNLTLLNTMMLAGVYQLTSRTFHVVEERWGKEEIIHTSLLPYIDFTFCVEENRKHYLFITQDDQVNTVIYQHKDIGLQKNSILFQHEKIDSCLLLLFHNVLWALWICENKLYGCFSTNYGQTFSRARVYMHFDNVLPVKVLFQEYLADNENKYISHEIYVMNSKEEEQLFLQELLENSVAAEMDDNESSNAKIENTDYKIVDLKDCLTKVKIFKKEKEELQGEIKRLNEAIEHEKNKISRLQYKFYEEKEKIKLYTNDNNRLKEKISYLEHTLSLKDKEKKSIEKKLAESKEENESLKQHLDVIRVQNSLNSEGVSKKSTNESSKQAKFSLIKWFFDDDNT